MQVMESAEVDPFPCGPENPEERNEGFQTQRGNLSVHYRLKQLYGRE
jgi:hypothetical protein